MKIYKIGALIISASLILGGCNSGGDTVTSELNKTEDSSMIAVANASNPSTSSADSTADPDNRQSIPGSDPEFNPEPFIKTDENALHTISQTYAEADIVKQYIDISYASPLQSFAIFLNQVHAQYPIQYLRRTDDKHVYAVYKTNEGGYLYMFFGNFKDEYTWGEDDSNIGLYYLLKAIYMKEALQYTDFQSVKIGQPISEVEKIDSVVEALKQIKTVRTEEGKQSLSTWHLLRDGVLFICYEAEPDKELCVTDIQYYPDFKQVFDETLPDFGVYSMTHDYSILPEDYPQN